MFRRDVLRIGGGATSFALAGCLADTDTPGFQEGFEQGLGDWEPSSAIGPEVPREEFEWEADVTDSVAVEGSRSLRIWNEGDYDDGTTWVTHPVAVQPERAYQATVTAQFWSESESFNTLRDAVMRLGPDPPDAEEDFPDPGVNTTALGETPYGGLREPLWLAAGWRAYTFEWTTPTLTTETLFLSLGTSVIWEGDATHYIDDITVDFESR